MKLWAILFLTVFLFGCAGVREAPPPQPYEFELWDYRQPLVGDEFAYQEQLLHVLEEFTVLHPHITIRVRILNWQEGPQALERARSEGQFPDIYRSLDLSQVSLHDPLHGVSEEEDHYWPAATSGISRDGIRWGWPSWLGWELWLLNTAWFEDHDAGTWQDWQRHGYSWEELGDVLAGKPASIDWEGSDIWQLYQHPAPLYVDRMLALAEGLQALKAQEAVRDLKLAEGQRLDDFYRGVTPVTAPVSPFLARYLIDRITTRSEASGQAPEGSHLLWLPPPTIGFAAEFPWQVSSYHVYKVEDDEERTLWAQRLAAYLAKHMGRWGAEKLGVIPALESDLTRWSLASELPLALRSAMIRDLERELPPLKTVEERQQGEAIWSEQVLPAMLTMLESSPLSYDELKEHLLEHLDMLARGAGGEEEETR